MKIKMTYICISISAIFIILLSCTPTQTTTVIKTEIKQSGEAHSSDKSVLLSTQNDSQSEKTKSEPSGAVSDDLSALLAGKSGKELLNALMSLYEKSQDEKIKREIERKYEETLIKYFADEICKDEMLNKIPAPKVLAISGFRDNEGKKSTEGISWANRLAIEIANRNKIKLVDRENVDKIIDLKNFELSDSANISELAKMVNSSAILMGNLSSTVEISIVSLDGQIIGGTYENRLTYPKDNNIANYISAELKTDSNPFGLNIKTDKNHYNVGDSVIFFCEAAENCYVTLFAIQRDNSLSQLYPNYLSDSGFLEKGKKLQIPAQDAKFSITAEPPAGKQKVFAIATEKPGNASPFFYNKTRDINPQVAFRSLNNPETIYQRTRDLKITLNENAVKDSNKWTQVNFEFNIEK
ncbi:DUF4384 domain-containing protein [Candidatus Dependentiae bacterium]|nr:DUF4384 domain-containing protein [Candidatus Dependentiae bacterium]